MKRNAFIEVIKDTDCCVYGEHMTKSAKKRGMGMISRPQMGVEAMYCLCVIAFVGDPVIIRIVPEKSIFVFNLRICRIMSYPQIPMLELGTQYAQF